MEVTTANNPNNSDQDLANAIAPTHADIALNPDLHTLTWSADGEAELKKIPFFVRGKIKRNTEKFASDRGINLITLETLYDAKAQIGK